MIDKIFKRELRKAMKYNSYEDAKNYAIKRAELWEIEQNKPDIYKASVILIRNIQTTLYNPDFLKSLREENRDIIQVAIYNNNILFNNLETFLNIVELCTSLKYVKKELKTSDNEDDWPNKCYIIDFKFKF